MIKYFNVIAQKSIRKNNFNTQANNRKKTDH